MSLILKDGKPDVLVIYGTLIRFLGDMDLEITDGHPTLVKQIDYMSDESIFEWAKSIRDEPAKQDDFYSGKGKE